MNIKSSIFTNGEATSEIGVYEWSNFLFILYFLFTITKFFQEFSPFWKEKLAFFLAVSFHFGDLFIRYKTGCEPSLHIENGAK